MSAVGLQGAVVLIVFSQILKGILVDMLLDQKVLFGDLDGKPQAKRLPEDVVKYLVQQDSPFCASDPQQVSDRIESLVRDLRSRFADEDAFQHSTSTADILAFAQQYQDRISLRAAFPKVRGGARR